MTLLELANAILRITGSKSEIVFHPLPAGEPQVRCPDVTRARELLSWEPEVDLQEGLRRLQAALARVGSTPSSAPASF
jgi:dTDP-glucose 4,6-dehydratase